MTLVYATEKRIKQVHWTYFKTVFGWDGYKMYGSGVCMLEKWLKSWWVLEDIWKMERKKSLESFQLA